MRKKIILPGFILALCFAGCASHKDLLARHYSEDAKALQTYTGQAGIKSLEIMQGDSLLALAVKNLKAGEKDMASDQAEIAVLYYRLAIAKQDQANQQAQFNTVKAALVQDQDKLNTYTEILNEMKAKRKP